MVAKNPVTRTPEEQKRYEESKLKSLKRKNEQKEMSYEELLQQASYKPVSTAAITKCAAFVGIPRMSQKAKVYLALRTQKYLETLIKLSMVDAVHKGQLVLKEENAVEAYNALKDIF